jgi:nicotinate-nucleotide--dimethylbenzimidazole phosphoribosyltransferase
MGGDRQDDSFFSIKVTQQMVYNFMGGGVWINVFARQNKLQLKIIDAG